MDKVKGKKDGKKSDRPGSSVDILNDNGEEPQKRSATMPASSNAKKNEIKSKAKTMSVDELNKDGIYDEIDSKGIVNLLISSSQAFVSFETLV